MNAFARLAYGVTISKKYAKAKFLAALGRSDYSTWSGLKNLDPKWDERSRILAELIVERNASVIEFGAGRLALKKYLPRCCNYTPSDLVDRGEGTIVLDLNARQLPCIGQFDIALFSGVIEYVYDVERLAAFTAQTAKAVVFSYVCGGYLRKPSERIARGWVHNCAADDLVRFFEVAGFRCEHRSFSEHSLVCRMSLVH